MTKRLDVGRSGRTPAKHALMSSIYGREVGVVNKSHFHRGIDRLVWIDLTAGDGVTAVDLPWHANCSPGINAHHATHSPKPVDVTLYEIKPATFGRLIDSLGQNLPGLGYDRLDDTLWSFQDRVILRAVLASGATATVDHIRPTDAVLVSNDPNAITDWAMRSTFAREVVRRGPWCFRSISTMGCNVGGLLRSDMGTRAKWFELIGEQAHALPAHRDLLLAAIEGDCSKWAYLLCEPIKWRRSVEPTVKSAFRSRYGRDMKMAWSREDPAGFEALQAELFLTRQEREAS